MKSTRNGNKDAHQPHPNVTSSLSLGLKKMQPAPFSCPHSITYVIIDKWKTGISPTNILRIRSVSDLPVGYTQLPAVGRCLGFSYTHNALTFAGIEVPKDTVRKKKEDFSKFLHLKMPYM